MSTVLTQQATAVIRSFLDQRGYSSEQWESITDFLTLGKRYQECPEDLRPAIAARYRELLQEVTDLTTLEKRYVWCPASLQPSVAARYRELLPEYLRSVTDLPTLEERYRECPEDLRGAFLQACINLLGASSPLPASV